jgi:hypothetical protein
MNATTDFVEFQKITKTYTCVVDGRIVVVHGVPYLQDPDTLEHYLDPQDAQRLFELTRNPTAKNRVAQADVYNWEAENQLPPLIIRYAGPGFDTGAVQLSQFAIASERVSAGTGGLSRDLANLRGQDFDPVSIEPRVRYVGSGSLVIALDYPNEAIFPDFVGEDLSQLALTLTADVATWVVDPTAAIPDSLTDPKVRAVALKALRRMVPRENSTAVNFQGQLLESGKRNVRLDRNSRRTVQQRLIEAVAETDKGEPTIVGGKLEKPSSKGAFDLEQTNGVVLKCRYDSTDIDLQNQIRSYWGKAVSVFGILRLTSGVKPRSLKVQGIELAD